MSLVVALVVALATGACSSSDASERGRSGKSGSTTEAPASSVATDPASPFPTAASTGVPRGTKLRKWTGDDATSAADLPETSRDGKKYRVMDGYLFAGGPKGRYLEVDDPYVIIRNSRFESSSEVSNTGAMVQVGAANRALVVETSEFDGGPAFNRGIQSDTSDVTVSGSRFHDTGESGVEKNDRNAATSLTVTGSYLTNDKGFPAEDHVDGIQVGGAKDVTIVGNTVLNVQYGGADGDDDYVSNSALGLWAELGNVSGSVLVQDNLLGGGGYTLYLQQKPPFRWLGPVRVLDNTFDTRFGSSSGVFGPLFPSGLPSDLEWSGNAFSDGRPISLAQALRY